MELYPHQKEAIDFLKRRWYNGALFMDCGLGKSRCILEFLKVQSFRMKIRALIVAPVSVMASWVDEITKWTNFTYFIIENPSKIENTAHLYLISYDRVYRYINELLNQYFSHLIIDESSKIRNIQTKRFKSLIKIAKKTPFRFILTGTPIANSLMDLYTQILILDFGKRLSSYNNFRETYFFKIDKFTYKEKFNAREKIFHTLKDIVFSKKSTDLIQQQVYVIDKKLNFSPQQEALYQQTLSEMKKAKNLLLKDRFLFFKYVYKLMAICSGVSLDNKAQQILSYKDEMLINILFEISTKTVIFHNFVAEGEKLRKIMQNTKTKFYEITSQMNINKRIAILSQFKNDDTKVLIMNVKIGGFGLNLGYCQNIIFFGPPIFSMETYKQATDRIHRVDSIYKSAFVFRIQVKNSLEEYVYKVIEHKEKLLDALYNYFGIQEEAQTINKLPTEQSNEKS